MTFHGLVPETRQAWQAAIADAQPMPVCGDGPETRLAVPPAWMRVENQGPINSCSANGMTSCAEKCEYARTHKSVQLSRWFQYVRSEIYTYGQAGRDQGATLSAALRVGREVGFVPESEEPYPATYDRSRTQFPREIIELAETRRITSVISLASGYSAWRTLLGRDIGAVLLGMYWPVQLDAHGVASRLPNGGGGHAIAGLFLADTTDANGNPDVWILNSHSASFGLGGWFKATRSFIEDLQARDDFGNVGVSDMSVPGPRIVDWASRVMIG
jgi:hypothetical protein